MGTCCEAALLYVVVLEQGKKAKWADVMGSAGWDVIDVVVPNHASCIVFFLSYKLQGHLMRSGFGLSRREVWYKEADNKEITAVLLHAPKTGQRPTSCLRQGAPVTDLE